MYEYIRIMYVYINPTQYSFLHTSVRRGNKCLHLIGFSHTKYCWNNKYCLRFVLNISKLSACCRSGGIDSQISYPLALNDLLLHASLNSGGYSRPSTEPLVIRSCTFWVCANMPQIAGVASPLLTLYISIAPFFHLFCLRVNSPVIRWTSWVGVFLSFFRIPFRHMFCSFCSDCESFNDKQS